MRGILSAAAYVPYRRLDRAEIRATFGKGGGRGQRTVASYDEDATTLAVEAARLALRGAPAAEPDALWFATTSPPYLDKTNATAIHAALRLDRTVPAFDALGSSRSATGALAAALRGGGTTLVASADLRSGAPTSADEAAGGDAGAALVVGDGTDDPDQAGATVLAEHLGGASLTEEFLDRWRTPGAANSKTWEERFGESVYVPLGRDAWDLALKDAGVSAEQVDRVAVVGTHGRANKAVARKLGVGETAIVDDFSATIGATGAAAAGLALTALLETAEPGQRLALISLADGADVFVFRATEALGAWAPARSVAAQVAAGAPVAYGTFLSWRGEVAVQPPNRPEPQRAAAPPSARRGEWKFGFVGSRDPSGALSLPPARISYADGTLDEGTPAPMADVAATIVTFTIDHLAYSPSPPIVFAVVDFDGGGRFPVELTDVDASTLAIGDRVEMTFRRLTTSDGVHNYFWKARPIRDGAAGKGASS
ncbi:MAG: OB-fold domain-containing protein [Acidimicrobiales bacterium]|nr:OB-fold domain-containing protein [Acidimicrobiales bacterium]